MGVSKYVARNKVRWRVDTYVTLPDGTIRRAEAWPHPDARAGTGTRAQAPRRGVRGPVLRPEEGADRHRAAALDRVRADHEARQRLLAVRRGPGERTWCASSATSAPRASPAATSRSTGRSGRPRPSRRGEAPSPATLDREVELLKRLLNYAAACGRLTENPIARVKLLRVPNVRRVVLDEEAFQRLSRQGRGVAPAHPARRLRHRHAQERGPEPPLVAARPQGRRRPARGRGHQDRRAPRGLPDRAGPARPSPSSPGCSTPSSSS